MVQKNSSGVDRVAIILRELFSNGAATDLLRAYYCRDREDGGKLFSGASFDTAFDAPGWSADAISEHDLLSLALLSVPVHGNMVRDHRAGFFDFPLPEYGKSLNQLVAAIPCGPKFEDAVNDDEAFANFYGDDKAAAVAWKAIRSCSKNRGWKFGATRTSKLLALKRPLLVPIYDDVVKGLFQRKNSSEHWNDMRALLLTDGIVDCIQECLHKLENSIPAISVIRAIDVILWMYGTNQRALRASGETYLVERVQA